MIPPLTATVFHTLSPFFPNKTHNFDIFQPPMYNMNMVQVDLLVTAAYKRKSEMNT